jgi:hypothetical protein
VGKKRYLVLIIEGDGPKQALWAVVVECHCGNMTIAGIAPKDRLPERTGAWLDWAMAKVRKGKGENYAATNPALMADGRQASHWRPLVVWTWMMLCW